MFSDLLSAIGLQWPYFCKCLLLAVTTPFAVIAFDLKWWVAVLLGGAIFVGWVILGILLQVVYGGSEEEESDSKKGPTKPTDPP